jgi:Spy/CpxP family protein refolding chaperone
MVTRHSIRLGLIAVGTILMLGAGDLDAQSVERIMRARERLELTEQQISQLEAIRRDAVAQRSAEMAELAELRSRLEAGQIRRSELMAAMEDRRDAQQARVEERRASIDALLTDQQRESLEELRTRANRPRARGAARGRPGGGPQPPDRGRGPGGRPGQGPR